MKILPWQKVFASLLALLVLGCGEPRNTQSAPEDEEPSVFDVEPVQIAGTDRNQLARAATAFLRERAQDAIHWQEWEPGLVDKATAEQRPIFAVVGNGRFTACDEFLDVFTNPANRFVDQFNDAYLCTLVDTDAHPEMALLAYTLSTEIRKPFSFPTLIWFSHEGNAVGWLSLLRSDLDNIKDVIERSDLMVSEIWEESPAYFVKNSRADNEARSKRLLPAPAEDIPDREGTLDLLSSACRNLSALYDPATRTIDSSGGLVPGPLLSFIGGSRDLPGLPEFVSKRSTAMLIESCHDLAHSPATDPLDHGTFASRRSRDWTLPRFLKTARTQSEMAIAYATAYQASGEEEFARHAVNTLAFARKSLGAGGPGLGAHLTVRDDSLEDDLYFWSLPKLQELLTPAQLEAAIIAFGIEKGGNIPTELDPDRRYFRRNLLARLKSDEEVARALSLGVEEAHILVEGAAETLRAHRAVTARELDAFVTSPVRVTEFNALHAYALLRCAQLLDEPDLMAEGRGLLTFLRERHYDEREGLWRIPPVEGRKGVKARGIDYALLIKAALEAYALELRDEDLAWAEALTREALRALAQDGKVLPEAPTDEQVGPLSVYSRSMILGRSTWGTMLDSLERLSRLSSKDQFAKAARDLTLHSLGPTANAPLVHTDLLESLRVPAIDLVAILHGDRADTNLGAMHRILLQPRYQGVVLARPEALTTGDHGQFTVPAGPGVSLFRSARNLGTATNSGELTSLLESALKQN